MAAERFAQKVSDAREHGRYIGVVGQIALGFFAILGTSSPGGSVAFIDAQFHLAPPVVGILFIITGIVAGLTSVKWTYWIAGVVFPDLYAAVSLWGALNHLVPFQAGLLYFLVASYNFILFPRGKSWQP